MDRNKILEEAQKKNIHDKYFPTHTEAYPQNYSDGSLPQYGPHLYNTDCTPPQHAQQECPISHPYCTQPIVHHHYRLPACTQQHHPGPTSSQPDIPTRSTDYLDQLSEKLSGLDRQVQDMKILVETIVPTATSSTPPTTTNCSSLPLSTVSTPTTTPSCLLESSTISLDGFMFDESSEEMNLN